MKAIFLSLFACLLAVWVQTPPAPAAAPAMPELPDDTVIATFTDGAKLTMGDFKKIYAALPPDNQQMALRDRKTFLESWGFMRRLSQLAEKDKLDQETPTRETLDYYRMMILSQAKIQDVLTRTVIPPAEIVKFYDVNKERYKQVHLRAIYIAFSVAPAAGSKALTEEQAKAKAAKLVADLKAGADFGKLARAESDDTTSREKDGDFATLRPNDTIPDAIKAAVFALKQGDISAPVKQPNGFYIFRAEEVTYRPLSQVRDEIYNELKQQHSKEWMDKANQESRPQFTSPAFLGPPPAAGKPK